MYAFKRTANVKNGKFSNYTTVITYPSSGRKKVC